MNPMFTPHILTIKIFSAGPAKATAKEIADHMMQFGTLVDVSVTPMRFDGMSLVPDETPADAPPVESAPPKKVAPKTVAPVAKAPKGKKAAKEVNGPKLISFAPGSDPERSPRQLRRRNTSTSTRPCPSSLRVLATTAG